MATNDNDFYTLGKKYLKGKMYSEAEKCFSKFIDLNPNHKDAYISRADSKGDLLDYKGAIKDCNKAIEIDPNYATAYVARAANKGGMHDYLGALEDSDKAIKIDLNYAPAYINRAYAKTHLQDYQGALEDCDKAIEIDPKYRVAYANRAYIKKYLQDYQGALEDCDKAIEIAPKDAMEYNNRADAKQDLQDYQGAFDDCNTAIEIDPNCANAYVTRANIAINLQDYQAALEDCNKAIEIDSNYEVAYVTRAVAKGNLQDYQGVLEDCDKAIGIDPNSIGAYINRGIAKKAVGDYQGAIDDYSKALKIEPNNAVFFASLGQIYYDWEREIEKAICCYRVALEIDPSNPEFQFIVANYYLEWATRKIIDNSFFNSMGDFSDACEMSFISENTFQEREKIAKAFYSNAFVGALPMMRTDLNDDRDNYVLHLFIGDDNLILNPLESKSFFFSDPKNFPDQTTDSPLLHPINQTKQVVQISYNNVRVRCLCEIEEKNGIEKCHSLWDRYAGGHKGIAYRLKIEKNWLINNSIYTNQIRYGSITEMDIKFDSPEQVIQDGLFIKHTTYSHEREWRMIKFGEFNNKEGIVVSWDFENDAGVTVEAIYLGMDMPVEMKQKVSKKAKSANIQVYKMELSENSLLRSIKI